MTNKSMHFDEFYDYSYMYGRAHRPEMPYVYGAYQMYEADTTKHRYMFYAHMNMTASEGVSLYPQLMYESIMKIASGDPEFNYKCRNTPYPITNEVIKRKVNGIALGVLFLLAVAFSLMVTTIMGQIVNERVSGIKHHQLISGLDLTAYWVANFFCDFMKMEFVIIIVLIAFEAANLQYNTAWVTFLLFPLAVIPMTYAFSFLFTAVSSAQTTTLAINFGSMIFMVTVVGILRYLKKWEKPADALHHFLKVVPAYTFGSAVWFNSAAD